MILIEETLLLFYQETDGFSRFSHNYTEKTTLLHRFDNFRLNYMPFRKFLQSADPARFFLWPPAQNPAKKGKKLKAYFGHFTTPNRISVMTEIESSFKFTSG